MKNTEKECRLVFNYGVTRELLRNGCVIVDIKPSRENADKNIFVFKNDDNFKFHFERINKEIADAKSATEVE